MTNDDWMELCNSVPLLISEIEMRQERLSRLEKAVRNLNQLKAAVPDRVTKTTVGAGWDVKVGVTDGPNGQKRGVATLDSNYNAGRVVTSTVAKVVDQLQAYVAQTADTKITTVLIPYRAVKQLDIDGLGRGL